MGFILGVVALSTIIVIAITGVVAGVSLLVVGAIKGLER